MNKKSLIITSLVCFVIAGGIGIGISKIIKSNKSDKPTIVEEVAIDNSSHEEVRQDTVNGSINSNPGVSSAVNDPISSVTKEVRISASVPKKNDETWSFRASCSGVGTDVIYHYELWGSHKIASSKTGMFSGIPDSPTGKYKLCVVDDNSNQSIGTKIVSGFKTIEAAKMSASTFQSILLNRKDYSLLGGKNKQVARNISFSFTGLHDGETPPDDVQSIRDKIHFGAWTSASVLSVGYDENGKINSAVIKPVYNENKQY